MKIAISLAHLSYSGAIANDTVTNGGDLFGNLIAQRTREDGINTFLIRIGPDKRLDYGAIRHEKPDPRTHFLAYGPKPSEGRDRSRRRRAQSIICIYKEIARNRPPSIDRKVKDLINKIGVKAYLFDYLYATLFFPWSLTGERPYFIVTGNREVAFYKEWLESRTIEKNERWIGRDTCLLDRYEKKIYANAAKVIAIGPKDVPDHIPAERRALVTCYYDVSPFRWRYTGSKNVFFIGNIGHYPNKLAIEYIVSRVAGMVHKMDPEISFSILGAKPTEISAVSPSNVNFLGVGKKDDADSLFLHSDILFCPVENDFGQKFKVVEAISHGTPFLASKQTMVGFPYLSELPYAPLEDPAYSASLLVDILNHPEKLKALSDSITTKNKQFISTQHGVWRSAISVDGIV